MKKSFNSNEFKPDCASDSTSKPVSPREGQPAVFIQETPAWKRPDPCILLVKVLIAVSSPIREPRLKIKSQKKKKKRQNAKTGTGVFSEVSWSS